MNFCPFEIKDNSRFLCIIHVKMTLTIIYWLVFKELHYCTVSDTHLNVHYTQEPWASYVWPRASRGRAHTGLLCSITQMIALFSTVAVHCEWIEHRLKRHRLCLKQNSWKTTFQTRRYNVIHSLKSSHSSQIFITHFRHPWFSLPTVHQAHSIVDEF